MSENERARSSITPITSQADAVPEFLNVISVVINKQALRTS